MINAQMLNQYFDEACQTITSVMLHQSKNLNQQEILTQLISFQGGEEAVELFKKNNVFSDNCFDSNCFHIFWLNNKFIKPLIATLTYINVKELYKNNVIFFKPLIYEDLQAVFQYRLKGFQTTIPTVSKEDLYLFTLSTLATTKSFFISPRKSLILSLNKIPSIIQK